MFLHMKKENSICPNIKTNCINCLHALRIKLFLVFYFDFQ